MSDESWYDDPDYMDAYFDGSDEGLDCPYGLTEFCSDPHLRGAGQCFCCEDYLDAVAYEQGDYDFMLFWQNIERERERDHIG